MSIDDIKNFGDSLESAASSTSGIAKEIFEGLKADLLNRLILATPVVTGNLRRGWTNGTDAVTYARSVPTISTGNGLMATFTNTATAYNTEYLKTPLRQYAYFVNFGHSQHPGQFVPPLQRRLVADHVEGDHFAEEAIEDFYNNAQENAYVNLREYLQTIIE